MIPSRSSIAIYVWASKIINLLLRILRNNEWAVVVRIASAHSTVNIGTENTRQQCVPIDRHATRNSKHCLSVCIMMNTTLILRTSIFSRTIVSFEPTSRVMFIILRTMLLFYISDSHNGWLDQLRSFVSHWKHKQRIRGLVRGSE